MISHRLITRGATPAGIRFAVLEDERGDQSVAIDTEAVRRAQQAASRRCNAPLRRTDGATAYHKTSSKLRGDL